MTWRLEWEAAAEEGLKHLQSWQAAARVCRAMMDFAETGRGDVRRLGSGQEFRLHVGPYVARFGIDVSTRTINVWTVFRKE
jgi:mRNA-degrading endonuclease RelE of RelBE toxin-antitoxin system